MKKIATLITFIFIVITVNAQMDTIVKFCTSYITYPYMSDGQQYRALLTGDQVAEFRLFFYGGATYRIIAATEPKKNSAVFRLYDKKRNLLFNSADHKDATYWDFKFESTVDCIIEAQLPETKQSGFVILLIGFKQD